MADGDEYMRQDVFSRSNPGPAKPRTRTRAPELVPGISPGIPKKPHRKSVTIASVPDEAMIRDSSPSHIPTSRDSLGDIPVQTPPTSAEETGEARSHVRPLVNTSASRPRSPPKDSSHPTETPKAGPSDRIESPNWSSDTITHVRRDRDVSGKMSAAKPRKHSSSVSKPNAVSFLDADSPQVTSEGIYRAMRESLKSASDPAKVTLPSAHSIPLPTSGLRPDPFEFLVDLETDGSNSPGRNADGIAKSRMPNEVEPRKPGRKRRQSYGMREMPRSSTPYPNMPPEELTPPRSNQHFVEQLPKTDKLPVTGYELLASKLSATSAKRGGRDLRPIYRRFEMLNHRILLNLQDEICELEEQLQRLDMADTQNRCLPNGILPASRRAETMTGGELQWHKTDTIWKIGFKLEQYNRVLSSFRQTCSLPAPTAADVQQYRGYLSSATPIADVEMEFLDATDDLVCLGNSDEDKANEKANLASSTPRSEPVDSQARQRASVQGQADQAHRQDEKGSLSQDQDDGQRNDVFSEYSSIIVLLAVAVSVVLPILTFAVIPGFMGRMTVVCLVAMGITGALVQNKMVELQATQESCVSVGLYGCVMALLAKMVN